MSNTNKDLLLEEIAAGSAQQAATSKAAVPYVDPSAITQSYYTSPTNASNYEAGRPVYSQSDAVQAAANQLAGHEQNKPGEYQSQYGDQIQGMIDSLLNRPKFNYDFSADPMYQQYAEKYQQRGKMAMKDTMGESAALTGGYGNSYAQTVGQQTYQTYLHQLYDQIPELRNAAYQMYQDEGTGMRANLGMLQDQDAADYGKHRDAVGDWQSELNYYYSKYNDMSGDEYNRYQNDAAAWEADRGYWYQKEQDAIAQANWEKEYALALAQLAASKKSSGGGSRSSKSSGSTSTDPNVAKAIGGLIGQGVNASTAAVANAVSGNNTQHFIGGGVSTAGYQDWLKKQGK